MAADTETDRDAELLEAVGEGDEHAFAELYQRYSAVVFAFVLARSDDRGDAEEISADVWLGCWRSAPAFRGDSRILTWLLGIAKRQIWTHTRRRKIPTAPLDEEVECLVDDGDRRRRIAWGSQVSAPGSRRGGRPRLAARIAIRGDRFSARNTRRHGEKPCFTGAAAVERDADEALRRGDV